MKGFDALHTTPQPATGLTLSYSKCSAGLYSHGRDTSETPRIDHGCRPVPARWKPAQPDSICRCARSPTTSVSPQQGLPETSNNIIIQKGLAFGRAWSGTVSIPSACRAPRSCPAGSLAEVGLWWCGATPPSTETEDLDVKVCEEAITSDSTHRNDCRKAVVAGNGQSPAAV